jgi:hypothetical protein
MDKATIVRGDVETRGLGLARAPRPAVTPGLDVSVLMVLAPATSPGAYVALVRCAGGTAPIRLSLHVDGAMVESRIPAPESCEFALFDLAAGPHAVTVRAIDARGRWGGASAVVRVRP